ncbi:MAG TPA: DNA-binding protein WhiA [Candidatus Limnocylindria bacterium]|nr:DNA-binding protein WhiA [Candidatus Limnocylindria bacterium]
MKAELARVRPDDCDRRVLAALLPRAQHLGAPARRLAHAAEVVGGRASLRRECCRRTYLRGLFLAGGSLSAGPSGYLLELRPPHGEATRARAVLKRERFAPRQRLRRGRQVLMLRDADEIASFLRHAGAGETLLRFESRRVSREMRGRTNASVNADAANLARAVAAARDQLEAVRALAQTGRLARLPSDVRAAAAARVRAPEATLAELAVRLETTKWVVRQRLRRIVDEAAR